jgi:hypothetical protein
LVLEWLLDGLTQCGFLRVVQYKNAETCLDNRQAQRAIAHAHSQDNLAVIVICPFWSETLALLTFSI